MDRPTDEELQTELAQVVQKHNQAQQVMNDCKTRAVQIQAILDDRRSQVVIPDTAPAPKKST